jgi:hypothetical protein
MRGTDDMNTSLWVCPPTGVLKLLTLYVAGLIAIVAASVCYPLCTPLLVLLFAWIAPFFALSCIVLVFSSILIFAVYAQLGVSMYRRVVRRGKPSFRLEAGNGPDGVWDRWLDGLGG